MNHTAQTATHNANLTATESVSTFWLDALVTNDRPVAIIE